MSKILQKNVLENYLMYRHKILINTSGEPDENSPYYNLGALRTLGVVVDKPYLLDKDTFFKLNTALGLYEGRSVHHTFYMNPQATKNFCIEELYIEQMASYFRVFCENRESYVPERFSRIPIFDKVIPFYKPGNEFKQRMFRIVTQKEFDEFAANLGVNLCKYSRPWSQDEFNDFSMLKKSGYHFGEEIVCKDNRIKALIAFCEDEFAQGYDKKDVVKISIELHKEAKKYYPTKESLTIISMVLQNVQDCPLSKKQAKYYNSILKKCKVGLPKESHKQGPYVLSKRLVEQGKIIEAAKVLKKYGSLLTRNLVWLLSRADISEFDEILSMVETKKPIIFIQIYQALLSSSKSFPRTFAFAKGSKVKLHTETTKELSQRKSYLSEGQQKELKKFILNKIKDYYSSKDSLGNIYISPEFKNINIPINTSATGSGLDVLPVGSRIPIRGNSIRAFCYWQGLYDVDLSALFKSKTGKMKVLNWQTQSLKLFGNSALTSGDNTSDDGAEYLDFRIDELLKKGYKYVVIALNGYGDKLNIGNIKCGYQDKEDLDTDVWSDKNIEFEISVVADSREYTAFAIDLENKEVVVVNQYLEGDCAIISPLQYDAAYKFLSKKFLEDFNMYTILSYLGNIVDNPDKADIVFDSLYRPIRGDQEVVHASDINKLIQYID